MYSVQVRIEDIEKRRRSAGLLHLVLGFFLIAKGLDYYQYLDYSAFLPVAPVLLVASFSLFYGFFRRQLDPRSGYNQKLRILQIITFLSLAFIFARLEKSVDCAIVMVFAILALLLFFSEKKIFEETCLEFDEKGITVPGSYREHQIPWQDLSEVIVREDFITLFHVKKKYLQFQVMQDLSTLEIAKMNAFCREKASGKASEEVQ